MASLAPVAALFGFLIGLLGYNGLPFLAGAVVDEERRRRLAWHYFRQMAVSLGRMLFVNRERAGIELCASSPNAEKGGAEQVTLDGEGRDWIDPGNKMQYLFGRPAGIVLEGVQAVIDPVTAETGAVRQDRMESDVEFIDAADRDGLDVDSRVIDRLYPSSRTAFGVDLDGAVAWLGGQTPPDAIETTYEYTKKSQLGFKNAGVMDIMLFAGLFIGTLVAIYLAFDFGASLPSGGGSNTGDGSTISGMVYWQLGGWA